MAKVSPYIDRLAQEHFQNPDILKEIKYNSDLSEDDLDLIVTKAKNRIACQLCDELLETLEYAADMTENNWVFKKLDRVIQKVKNSIDEK
jgi:hypothetical protein